MNQTPLLHELLYVSTMSPGLHISVVGQIARQARLKNRYLGITGLLVFDGQRFCQHLEGSVEAVLEIFALICRDLRHIDVNLLHQGALSVRKFREFSMGFANADNAGELGALEQLSGEAATGAFDAMQPGLDVSP